jgi:hypothetical protein
MAFTRNQAQKQQQQQQQQQQREQTVCKYPNTVTLSKNTNCTSIDFIDASIEWRKNKVKKENCTFEYI